MDEVSRGLDDMALGNPDETSQHQRAISPAQACGCAELVSNEFGDLPTPLHRCMGQCHLPIIKEEIQGDQLYLTKLANKPQEDKSPQKSKFSPEDSSHMSGAKDSLEETLPRHPTHVPVVEVPEPQEPSEQKIDRDANAQAELESTEVQSLFQQSGSQPVHKALTPGQANPDDPDTICASGVVDVITNSMGGTSQVENHDAINAEKLKLDQADRGCQDENSPLQADNTDITVKDEHILQHICTSDEDSTIRHDDQIQGLAQGQLERQNQPVIEHSEKTEECIAADLLSRQDERQEEVHAVAQPADAQSDIPYELYTEDMYPAENESVISEPAAAQSQSFTAQGENDLERVLKKVPSQTVLVYTASDELSSAQAVPEGNPQHPMQASSESSPDVANLQSEDTGQVAESVQVVEIADGGGAEAEVNAILATGELNFIQASDSAGASEFNASIMCTKEL